ncbi:MAG: hypothetical protein LH467_05415 [Gemmatimonadaceae bacterium]|nr:hypothetical protein [Gemmatimonadaceae bacterium]
MNNLALFVVGVVITIPTAPVVIALVFAAGIDERAEKKRVARHEPATTL